MAKRKKITEKEVSQYEHTDKERLNNPPAGLIHAEDVKNEKNKKYEYDPHLDPQLQWAGKGEHTSFEVPTVNLHVHERIDPKRIVETVKKEKEAVQPSLFDMYDERPMREAVEFYKHRDGWTNRLVSGDSLLVMNSLLEKEGMAEKVQMVYFDPPYGIKYGSNFQPFTNKRDVKDGKDDDLTTEPEMIKAFRDTWELGIHSYLTYMRDRLLLARELLTESGSIFVQISDENVHHVRELLDEMFGKENFQSIISFTKAAGGLQAANRMGTVLDYIVWYCKDNSKVKYRPLYEKKQNAIEAGYTKLMLKNFTTRSLTKEEKNGFESIPEDALPYMTVLMTKPGPGSKFNVNYHGRIFNSRNRWWGTTPEGIENVIKAGRVEETNSAIRFISYFKDFPHRATTNLWSGYGGAANPMYVVQTNHEIIKRCLLMSTDPGDLVLDITCGSGTTAFVAEQWGRRWITCDTSRVAVTLAKQRLMTATFDYYKLMHPTEGIGSGLKYQTVPHITLKSIANNKPPKTETLYDKPLVDNKKVRVTGPFTVEAVPSPTAKSLEEIEQDEAIGVSDDSVARSGETQRMNQWRQELQRTGIRAKGGEKIMFSRVEPLEGTRHIQAEAETKEDEPKTVYISFGHEFSPYDRLMVERTIMEASHIIPKPDIVVFAAFEFTAEAIREIEETNWRNIQLLKVQMNADLFTDDLKKKRSSNESFWLIGSPDVSVVSGEFLVASDEGRGASDEGRVESGKKVKNVSNQIIGNYDKIKIVSGFDSLAKINKLNQTDLFVYAAISQDRSLWTNFTNAKGERFDSKQYSGGTSEEFDRRIYSVSGNIQRLISRIRDTIRDFKRTKFSDGGNIQEFIDAMRRDKQTSQRLNQIIESSQITNHSSLTTHHYYQVEVNGFDYYDPKKGTVNSGGKKNIAVWMLDTSYDGRSLFPDQVFFPMSGKKDGWSRLAKNLKAEIDEEKIESYRGTVSLPFTPEGSQIAVKIVDDRGIESLKIITV